MRYVAAVFSFLLMWVLVGFLCTLAMVVVFPGGGTVVAGMVGSPDWRSWPGAVLGFLAGLHSARAALKPTETKSAKTEISTPSDAPIPDP